MSLLKSVLRIWSSCHWYSAPSLITFEEFGVLVLLIMSLNVGCCFLKHLNVDNDANRKEFRVCRSCPLKLETTRWKYLMKMSSLCNSMRIMLVFLPTWILPTSTSAFWQRDKTLDLNPSFMFLDAYCVSCLRYWNLEFQQQLWFRAPIWKCVQHVDVLCNLNHNSSEFPLIFE